MSQAAAFPAFHTLSEEIGQLANRVAGSLVTVRSDRYRSTGFVWKPGLVVTADEALAADESIELVPAGGETIPATLAGRDPTTDIALLRTERSDLVPVEFATEPASVGSLVVAVGAKDGAPTAMLGLVSLSGGPWRSMRGGSLEARIELDLRLRSEAEGAVVLDAAGRMLGMAVLGPRRRTLVIPSATIERIASRLESDGRIARGYLGLGLQRVRRDHNGGAGIMVMSVDPQGPGARAGVRQGDVIVAWDGRPVRGPRTLVRALGPDSVGSNLKLSLHRGGEPLEVSLTVGERPPA